MEVTGDGVGFLMGDTRQGRTWLSGVLAIASLGRPSAGLGWPAGRALRLLGLRLARA